MSFELSQDTTTTHRRNESIRKKIKVKHPTYIHISGDWNTDMRAEVLPNVDSEKLCNSTSEMLKI